MKLQDRYDGQLRAGTLDEANRIITVIYRDMIDQYHGKRFWMWMFIANVFVSPILEPLLQAIIEDIIK